MKLIVGLGNPGPEYEQTRHNAGFMVVRRFADRFGPVSFGSKFQSQVGEVRLAEQRCMLLLPMTYMNRSGQAVRAVVDYFDVDPLVDLLVVVDDVALPVGRIRVRAQGGSGGHNGLRDVESVLGSKRFARLRIGIDPPGRATQTAHVLGRFSRDEVQTLDPALDTACDAIACWVEHGIDQAMNRYNPSTTSG